MSPVKHPEFAIIAILLAWNIATLAKFYLDLCVPTQHTRKDPHS